MNITFIILLFICILILIKSIKINKRQNKLMKEIQVFNKRLVYERQKIWEILVLIEFIKEKNRNEIY